MPLPQAVSAIRGHFEKNSHVKDERVRSLLINKGYMELEETLMQWKQKAQLMRVFEGWELRHIKSSVVQPDAGNMGPRDAHEEFLRIKEGQAKPYDQLVSVNGELVHYSEEFDRAIQAAKDAGFDGVEEWRSWANTAPAAPGAPFKETLDCLFKNKFFSYMSEREELWDDVNAQLMGALQVVKAKGQSALAEAEYLDIVTKFVNTPRFLAWHEAHAFDEPASPLDSIIPAESTPDEELHARAKKDGIPVEDVVSLILMEIQAKIDKHPNLADHLVKRKIGTLVSEDLTQLLEVVNAHRWDSAETSEQSIRSPYEVDPDFKLPHIAVMEASAHDPKKAARLKYFKEVWDAKNAEIPDATEQELYEAVEKMWEGLGADGQKKYL
jgi:hypothetical protein